MSWLVGWCLGRHRDQHGSVADDDAPVGRVILDWTWTRGWACTTIFRNALCVWASTNGRIDASVGQVIRPGEAEGQEDGTMAVVTDYVWVYGLEVSRKCPGQVERNVVS